MLRFSCFLLVLHAALAVKPRPQGVIPVPNPQYFIDGDLSDYARVDKIGSGAFSEVFLGYRHSDQQQVVLKHIADSRMKVINKEIQVLLALKGVPYVVQLLDYIRGDREATLVYPWSNSTCSLSHKIRLKDYTHIQMKRYFYELFFALSQAHERRIMHRDIKGSNILVTGNDILVIDWGLASYLSTNGNQSTRMGTRYYKAPELLLGYKKYDYAIDIWAAGCVLADFVFQQHPLVKGKDNAHQLQLIVQLLGLREFRAYIQKYKIVPEGEFGGEEERFNFSRLINHKNKEYATEEALDLLNRIFVYDHKDRINATEILAHPYFQELL